MGRTVDFVGQRNRQLFPSVAVKAGRSRAGTWRRQRSAVATPSKSVARELIRASELASLGQFDFDPQLDLGQDRIEAQVA